MRESDPLLGHTNGHTTHQDGAVGRGTAWARFKGRLDESVDVDKCGPALTMQCFMAGAADAAAYGQTTTWAAFMTGNITQLSMSAAKLVFTHPSPPESVKRLSQSSSAVLGFIVGSYLASVIDAQFHSKHRGKLFVIALVRSFVFALVAFFIALIGWDGGNGYVGMALLFVLASNMGTMAVNASRLGSTPYATTVVFTSTLASIFSDPALPFSLSRASKTRGISVASLVLGGALSQSVAILIPRAIGQSARMGSAYAIAMVAVADIICALCWLRAGKTDGTT